MALLFSTAAQADSYRWAGQIPTGDWDTVFPLNLPGNWFDITTNLYASTVPGGADDVTFGAAIYDPFGVNMSGPHAANSITFDTDQPFTINNSGGLTTSLSLTSGSLTQTANDTGSQTISVPLVLGHAAAWALNGTGTIVVSQPISSNAQVLGLTTSGIGNLTLQGQNTYQGNTIISGSGTVQLTGSIGSAIGGADPSLLIVDSQQGANFVLASVATDSSTLISSGTVIGRNAKGSFTQNGGSHITKQLAIGYFSNSNGAYTLLNGSLTTTTNSTIVGGDSSNDTSGDGSSGAFNQSGGVHQTPQLEIASSPNAAGSYTLSGGVLSVSQATFIGEGDGAVGQFVQSGGQNSTQALVLGKSISVTVDPIIPGGWNRVKNVRDTQTQLGSARPAVTSNPSAKYILSGGTLTTEAIEGLSAGTEFDFNGGTLKPTVNLDTFISGLDAAVVQAGGAVIDTSGFNITIPQALLHDASLGATPDGGLTKNGAGIMRLTGSTTYTGPTVVNGGIVYFPATAGTLASTHFTANAGADLILNGGNLAAAGSLTDNGIVQVAQFTSDGSITIAGGTSGATLYVDATNLGLSASSRTSIGSAATPGGSLILQNGATVQLNGKLSNNGNISGEVDVNSGGVLSGDGNASTITVQTGGTLHAGNSPGTMHATHANLAGGSSFQFDINAATGVAGTNWSLLAVTNELTLDLVKGQTAGPVILKLTTLAGQDDSQAPLTDFDASQSYSWQFASFGSLDSNGGPLFQIDFSGFGNAINGGSFSYAISGPGVLSIDFTPAPEPTGVSLLALAGFGCLRRRRERVARLLDV